jgi:hypothetical protein
MPTPATLDLRGRSPEPIIRRRSTAHRRFSGEPARARRRPGPYAIATAGALVLALASLTLASAPSYDPWAWIIWGRELLHLSLQTTGGPTWKPLPVLFTTLLAPFGRAAPDLWLVVARTGGIIGVAMSSLLAFRLARAGPREVAVACFAGVLAALGLLALSGLLDSVASGESEGLLVALVAFAVLRHLDGAPRQSLALGFAAALIRPETWPFFGLYCVYLWRRDRGARKLIVALLVLIPALWFLPELWGARSVLRGVEWARYPRAGSPAFASCPFCAEITAHAWPLVVAPFKLGVGFALGCAAFARGRRGWRSVAVLGAAALAWILEEGVLTQAGFSGSDRYLIAPAAILIVAGSVGWGWAGRRASGRAAVAALAALLVASTVWDAAHLANLATTGARQRVDARLRQDLSSAVREAGGAGRLISCGSIQTNPSEAPLAAWTLGVPMLWTENPHGNVLIQSRNAGSAVLAPLLPRGRGYRLVSGVGTVRIFEKCA